ETEVDADLAGDDGNAERRRLQQTSCNELAPALGERPVEHCRDGASEEESGEEQRHTCECRAAVEEARDVELDPGRDEEERHEDAEADGLELPVEEGMRHPLVAIDELQRRAGEEGA